MAAFTSLACSVSAAALVLRVGSRTGVRPQRCHRRAGGDRLIEECGPRLHELAAPIEQVGSLVGALHRVADDVRQRLLDHLVWKACSLAGPDAKRRAKTMR